jgi:hypothetical protein
MMSGPHRDLQVPFSLKNSNGSSCRSAPDAAHSKTIRIVDLFPSNNTLFRETQCRQGEWQYHTFGKRFSQHYVIPTSPRTNSSGNIH